MTDVQTTLATESTGPTSDLDGVRRSTSYAADKERILNRLRRMEGQVRGVQKMVEGDQYCVDVLTQISAIISAARGVGLLVLEDHIRGCVMGSCSHDHEGPDGQEAMLAELTQAIERFTRTAG
jgi:CsoR family transcriptional regulator, copper-sensing transcriptional repressor